MHSRTMFSLHSSVAVGIVYVLFVTKTTAFFLTENATETYMSREERNMLKLEAKDMFYHAYNAYMNNAYPADELMPLSCKGRYRNSEPSRGNVDEVMGNFSMTLIDTLDMLVVLGDFDEFERAVKLVIRDVTFDTDVVVSVFETNIRVLGGLLSAHVLSEVIKTKYKKMSWYQGELLDMAKDVGYRLLPAFNTTTGIPYGRVNLKYGIKQEFMELTRDTCTACAGTMILEMAALSRLTGESIFEEKAQRTMDKLWDLRHRTSNLMGTILNVHSGDWIRRDSGVGAGIDSYYEYCLKGYILLSDEKYLRRFNTHYSAVMMYISQGPMLLDVHMHKPNTISKNFMDALLAFWPGLQVLKGDLKPAIETHEMLYQVMQRHKFIPEAFTTDFQIHWGHHPLRPEFLESTYFLYRATGDHYYLHVGRNVLRSLQTYARVACGFASVKDVRTGAHEDSMDSFVLSETFKYLYLIFAEPSEIPINLDDYLFTTEAHFLPLSISRYSPPKKTVAVEEPLIASENDDVSRSCVLEKYVGHILRQNLRNMVEGICPQRKFVRKLYASQFQSYNKEHVKLLNDMGITVAMLSDGRMQLVHNFVAAASRNDANEGVLFMQEMDELSRTQSTENIPQAVSFTNDNQTVVLNAGPANFGRLLRGEESVIAKVGVATPLRACKPLENASMLRGRIVIVERGECMFVDKARKLEKAGAIGGIIVDNIADSSSETWPLFAMSGDGKDDVSISVVFLFTREAKILIDAATKDSNLSVTLSQLKSDKSEDDKRSRTIYTLEKLEESLEGILYKPDIVEQERSPDRKKSNFAVESVRLTLPTSIHSNKKDDDAALVKKVEPIIVGKSSPATQSQFNRVTVKAERRRKRDRSAEDLITDNFRQKLNELLRKALLVESRRRGEGTRHENDVADADLSTASAVAEKEEITEELLDIEREFTQQHELLKRSSKVHDDERTTPADEGSSCTSESGCKTKRIEQSQPASKKTHLKNTEDDENGRFRNENFSQTKYDSLRSFVENTEQQDEESVEDLLELEKKYKELLLKLLDMYERDAEKANENSSERSTNAAPVADDDEEDDRGGSVENGN